LQVWIDLPQGWQADRVALTWSCPPEAVSDEVRRLDFEVRPPAPAEGDGGPAPAVLKGYALFNACEDADGRCLYLRRDFEVALTPPR
jgi:hypothetical protein